MLEKPNLSDEKIISCLYDAYRFIVENLTFLPLGADANTAVYRATTADKTPYFIKLRHISGFRASAVIVPKFLSDLGIAQIIPPLPTCTGELWVRFGSYNMIVFPFVQGKNGFEQPLTAAQRIEFGRALKKVHTAELPESISKEIPRETFSGKWHILLAQFMAQIEHDTFTDPIAQELATFLNGKRKEIDQLLHKFAWLLAAFPAQASEFVLCHADIHAWNLLLTPENQLYMVDWDTLIFAPKERDLMFIGAGLGGHGHSREDEERFFYQGYGATPLSLKALAYYRYERIIEDIVVYCQQIFLTDDGGEDRQQAVHYVRANFLPDGTIDLANRYEDGETFVET